MYGVCASCEDACELSFESPVVDVLFGFVAVLRPNGARLTNAKAEQLIPYLVPCARFLQSSDKCSCCRQPVVRAVAGGRKEPRLKRVLDCVPVLQQLGLLDAESEAVAC